MAPTEGRVAKPEQQWGCHHGTPPKHISVIRLTLQLVQQQIYSLKVLSQKTAQTYNNQRDRSQDHQTECLC